MKILLVLLFLFISGNVWASAPNRPNTYTSGTTISSVAVTQNETTLYSYLQAGVDTYKAGSITAAAVSSTAGIMYSQLNLSGGILPGDINTTTTTNTYQFGSILVPNNVSTNTLNVGATPATNSILYFGSNPVSSYYPTVLGYNGPSYPYINISNTQVSGVGGGASLQSGSTWETIPLNTINNNTGNIATLSSNQVTLPAGTYYVSVVSPFYASSSSANGCQLRLFNNSTSSSILTGTETFTEAFAQTPAFIRGIITLSSSSNISLQYQVTIAQASNGLGIANSYGTEVYTVAEFTKIS